MPQLGGIAHAGVVAFAEVYASFGRGKSRAEDRLEGSADFIQPAPPLSRIIVLSYIRANNAFRLIIKQVVSGWPRHPKAFLAVKALLAGK